MTQQISSLMDSELDTPSSEQAIRDCGSPHGMQAWETYHLIGELLREGKASRFDVSAAVMKAIEEQKITVLAPAALKTRPRAAHSFGRVALAAAASVATIGVVGWIGTQGMPGASTAPAVAQSGGGVTLVTNAPVEQAKHLPEPSYAAIEVNEYLAAHRQVPTPDQYRAVAARTPAPAR